MTRAQFGGGPEDVYLIQDDQSDLQPGPGANVLFYSTETGNNPITDLLDLNSSPINHVTTSTGSDGRAPGQVPPFYGPDEVYEMWASANGSPRFLMQASNLGSTMGPVKQQYTQHAQQPNAHGTKLRDLTDVTAPSPTDGQALVYQNSSGKWIPGTVAGGSGSGDVTTTTDQTLTGSKTFTPAAAKSGVKVVATATGQTGNLFEAQSGTDTGQGAARQTTTTLNPAGELRVTAAKSSSIPARIKAQPTPTSNLTEWADSTDAAKAWVGPNFGVYAPNLGRTITFAKAGAVAVGIGAYRWYCDLGVTVSIRSVRVNVGTASTSGTPTVDVNVNGASIYGTQANRPTVAVGAFTSGKNTGFSTTAIPDGSYLSADIDVAGTGTADLVVQIELW